MKIATTIKTLERNGFLVVATQQSPNGNGIQWIATHASTDYAIEFSRNGWKSDEVAVVRVAHKKDQDDPVTDYCAGHFCDTLKGAINYALTNNRSKMQAERHAICISTICVDRN